jgi:uncharacterized repeat protein (TIGR02543 family)
MGGSYISARKFTEPTDVDFEDENYIPTREGYTFTGWYKYKDDDSSLLERLNGTVTVSTDMTVFAGWAKDGVTLTLVYSTMYAKHGIGRADETIEYDSGAVVDLSTVDNTVVWYDSARFKNIITEVTMNQDKTIYAKVSLTLVYDQEDSSKNEIYYWAYNTLGLNLSQHYGAVDWYEDEDFTKPITTIDMDANKTVYARAQLTKVYDQSDDKIIADEIEYYKVDQDVTLSENYNWYSDPECTKPITSVTMDANKTIYAKTTSGEDITAFRLTYVSNGGAEFELKVRTFMDATDVDFEDPDYIPTREKYEFTGWYADSALTTRMDGIVNVSGDMTVYAGWKQITATLTMVRDQNWKDTHTGIPDISTEMPVGSTVDITTDTVNWYEDPDLEMPITKVFILTEDKTIYAGVVLTLVYDPLYRWTGEGTPDVTIVMPIGTKVDMTTLTIPGHEGDDPVSWTTESGVADTVITEPFVMYENKTIYAKATISGGGGDSVTFHLIYDSNGGSDISAREFTEPTEVDFDDPNYIPTREGYEFTGWYMDSDPATQMTGKVEISTDTTVIAGWKKNTAEEETKAETPVADTPKEVVEETPAAETPTESKKETAAGSNETGTRQSDKQQNTIQETSTPDTIDGNVSTGDQSNVTLWFTVLMLSCMGIVAVTIYKKKRR